MNTHSEPSRVHTSHEEDPHRHDQLDAGSGGVHIGQNEEHHGDEKPSMMTRVRARARKMSDSIKEHVGHGHDHDEVDDADDDEMGTDSEKLATHTSQSVMPEKEGVARQHEPKLEGRTAAEGAPVASKRGDYQTFDPTTTKYTPGQDEATLGWSRTDTGKPKESEEQPYETKRTPAVATHLGGGHSTGDSEIGKEEGHTKLGGLTGTPLGGMEENREGPKGVWGHHSPANNQAKVADPTSIGNDSTADQGIMPEGHGSKLGERTAMEGVTNDPMNNPQGDHQTFDTNPASYAHGQDATLRAEEASNASKDTPFAAHSGGKEIGVTPVLHHLDRMNIHEEPQQKQNIISSQEESRFETENGPQDKKLSSGSHDQFFPEPVTSEPRTFLETPESGSHGLGDEGWHNKSEQKQESSAGMASSAGAMMADKAKQATSSVTPKQGYGGSFDKQSSAVPGLHQKHSEPGGNAAVQGLHEKHSEPGGNAENISIATAVVADKAVQAKGAVATKVGYGGPHEEQPVEGESKGGSIVETMKGKIGSSMASKVQGSGTQHEVGPATTPTDSSDGTIKGASMKENLIEKLKPGEDDKALSEVITEALPLHKRKEDVSKPREEEEGKEVPIKGRVTDSEKVATQLGRSKDTSCDEAGTGISSPGKGVMGRIMDAATSWYHKPDVSPTEDIQEGKEGSSSIMTSEDDIKEGKEGSSSIMTSEDVGADGQYKATKD